MMKKWMMGLLVCLLVQAVQAEVVYTNTIVLQPGSEDGLDTYFSSYGLGMGATNRIHIGGWGDDYYGQIQFDLEGMPEEAISAVISLHVEYMRSPPDMRLDRITESWDENVKWSNKPAATYIETLPKVSELNWYDIDVTDLYNDWKSGTYENYGIRLRPTSTHNNWGDFYSSDYSNAVVRPKLTVTYAGNPDTDGDGMADAWEMLYFQTLEKTADGDADADGRTNFEEMGDGTVPTNSASTLDLVAYYPFDGNADDATGNGHDGTVYGTPLVVQNFLKSGNTAFRYDGVDDFIEIPHDSALNPINGDMSFSFYAVRSGGTHGNVLSKLQSNGNQGYLLMLRTDTENKFQIFLDDTSHLFDYSAWVQPVDIMSTNHYVACIDRSSGKAEIYINGEYRGADTQFGNGPISASRIINHTGPLYVGTRLEWGHHEFFTGIIDEVRIYNRALSSNEVARLYAGTVSTNTSSTVKPDLSSLEMTVFDSLGNETANPAVGELVNFEVTVHNTGDTNASGNVLVQIFEGVMPTNLSNYVSNDFNIVASGVITNSIAVGGSKMVLISWTVDAPDRMATLSAVAEFSANRAASESGSALPVAEESLANNSVGQSLQIGSPSGNYGIEVVPAASAGLTSGQSFTLSGTANYDWGGNEPVLGALATITVNGEIYTDRTASPDGAWSVLVNGLPVGTYTAHIEVNDGRLSDSTNVTLVVGSGPQTIDLRVKQIVFESGTYRHVGETGYAVTGESVVLRALVRNDGNMPSGDFAVAFGVEENGTNRTYATYTTNVSAFSEIWVAAPAGWTATAGTHTLTAEADSGEVVTETSETNNERTCTVVAAAAKPDLMVTDISWSPGSPKDGDSVTLTATVKNQGGAVLPSGSSFDVLFSMDGATVAAEPAAVQSDLPNGASMAVSTTWTATVGSHSVSAEADSGAVIDEDFENNNVRTETLSVRQALPDLRPSYYLYGREGYSHYHRSGLSFSPSKPVAGEAVTVSCDIYNNGTVPLPAGASFDVQFTVDGATVATETVALLSDLAVNAKVQVSTVWNSTAAGTVSFGAVVDTTEVVTEESEINNATSKGLTVYPVAADLAAVGLGFSPLQPLPGASVTLTASIRNNGGAAGGDGETVEFFAGSTNAVDKLGETTLVADIAEKGGTGTAAFSWTAPASAGNVTIYAMINGSVYSKTLTVTENPVPNLQLFSEDISVSPALPNSGESVAVLANIRNTEGATATNFLVQFSVDSPLGGWVELGAPVAWAALETGSNVTVVSSATITAERSAYSVKVEILPNENQGDADEGDNSATSSFLLADTPRADAGGDTNCFVGQTITFDGSGSANASNQVWSVVSAPSNSVAALSGADTASPSLTPDQPGLYDVQLIVDNGTLFSEPDTVVLTAEWIEWIVESAHGNPVPALGTNWVEYGTVLTNSVEAAVTNGTTFYACTGYGEPPEGGTTYLCTVTNHGNLVWNWSTNYWVETESIGDGQVIGGNAWMPAGTNAPLAATPDYGWLFMGWSGDLATGYTQSNATLLVDAPKSVAATFSDDADGDGLLNTNETAIGTNPRDADSDGDGIDDGFEVGSGYNPTNSDSALLDYILADKETFGYYTEEELGALAIGNLMIGTSNGNANLWLQLWKSDDLDSWTNAGEAVLWQMPAGEGKQFYKVQAGE